MKIRLFLLFLLLCQSLLAFSDTFIVTSNADNGTGTLREAIYKTNANGTSLPDYIHFNLPGSSEADRTITLLSELPWLTSNITLDATTQPGANLGSSPAKVLMKADRLIYHSTITHFGCFNIIGITDLEIYGFAFDQFYDLKTKLLLNNNSAEASGIYIIESKRVTIGAPGKGNVFIQNNAGVRADERNQIRAENIKVQSNWFGFNLDGSESDKSKHYLVAFSVDNSEFGGPDASYGNIMGGYSAWGFGARGTNIKILFNSSGISPNGNLGRSVTFEMNLTDGEFTDNQAGRFAIDLRYGKNIKLLRNKERSPELSVLDAGIDIEYSENVQIGSENIADANEFLPISKGTIRNFGGKNVEVRKNIIHCTPQGYVHRDEMNVKITVLVNNDSEYSGTATPGSEIYIYNDNSDCPTCSPLQFYAQINADAAGKWSITGDFRNNKFVANATLINTSSEFTQPIILSNNGSWYNKKNPSCGNSDGEIELAKTANILRVEWFDFNDQKVGEGFKITGLPPGSYYAKGYNGKCFTKSFFNVNLVNVEPKIIAEGMRIQQPACGERNGSIMGIYALSTDGSPLQLMWVDENNNIINRNDYNVSGLGPGKYTLITIAGGNCRKTYGPITLTNQTGPAINQSAANVQGSSCNSSTGFIKNIQVTGTGTITYTWKNATGNVVGNTPELINVPAGIYTLEVKDESACPPLSSAPIPVAELNSITINASGITYTKSTCNTSNGSITGITTTGTTGYKWLDAGNTVVATTLDLTGMPPGKYRLVASNTVCEKTTEEFTIEMAQSAINYGTTKILTNATCGLANGKIEAIFSHNQPSSCFWKNDAGQIIGHSRILENQPPGAYDLYFVDDLGCTKFAQQYSISNTQPANINPGSALVTNDQCGFGKGQITAPLLSGGQRPYFYEWKDKDGRIIGSAPVLSELKAGDYQLTVGDALECGRRTFTYTVLDQSASLPKPVVNDIKVCSAGKAVVQVMAADKGPYAIYDDSGVLIETSNTGTFNLDVSQTQTYSVVMQQGNCQSAPATVKVTIENDGIGKLANAFSPNSDGQNDEWLIPGIINYPTATVSIYNRYGVKVFDAVGYKTPFNGRSGGADLPIGTYYYIIDLKRGCGLQKGSLTIIR